MRPRPRSRCAAPSGPAGRPWHRQPVNRGQLVGSDAALGAHHQHHRLRLRQTADPSAVRSADSCSASTVPPDATTSPIRWVSAAVDSTPSTDGIYARRDCCAAARATARQRRRPLSARAPSQRATQRAACQATNAVGAGFGGQLDRQLGALGFRQRLDDGHRWLRPAAPANGPATRACRPSRPVCSTTQRARPPTPSPRISSSPRRMRRTVAAWKPSSPSTTASSPVSGSASM